MIRIKITIAPIMIHMEILHLYQIEFFSLKEKDQETRITCQISMEFHFVVESPDFGEINHR